MFIGYYTDALNLFWLRTFLIPGLNLKTVLSVSLDSVNSLIYALSFEMAIVKFDLTGALIYGTKKINANSLEPYSLQIHYLSN